MFLFQRHRLIIAALSAFLLSLTAAAGANDANNADDAALRKLFAEPLQTVHRWSDLPPEIRKRVSAPWNGESIADPGQPFQESDAVPEPGLPWRRLIIAAHTANVWVGYYERGGIDLSCHLAVVPFQGKDVAYFVVKPPMGKEVDGLQHLRALAEKGEGIWASEGR